MQAEEILRIRARVAGGATSWPRPLPRWSPICSRQQFLVSSRTGGAALWLFAPARDRAGLHLVELLADYDNSFLRNGG